MASYSGPGQDMSFLDSGAGNSNIERDHGNEDAEAQKLDADDAEGAALQQKNEKKEKRKTNIPKLTKSRLLDPQVGIWSIRPETENLKLKGRGHEYEDLDAILGYFRDFAKRCHQRLHLDDFIRHAENILLKKSVDESDATGKRMEPPPKALGLNLRCQYKHRDWSAPEFYLKGGMSGGLPENEVAQILAASKRGRIEYAKPEGETNNATSSTTSRDIEKVMEDDPMLWGAGEEEGERARQNAAEEAAKAAQKEALQKAMAARRANAALQQGAQQENSGTTGNGANAASASSSELTEEQRACIAAKRAKFLEARRLKQMEQQKKGASSSSTTAASSSTSSNNVAGGPEVPQLTDEQRQRIEENRAKAAAMRAEKRRRIEQERQL
ncbi:unnamed protein product [Amoebophrya sp. A25]|nr:unnamed protein product [Amoebophrya sp. A25]|eukprot:GSA25T00002651001.1